MRYSNRVIFVTETEGGFNPDTGNHDDAEITRNEIACNISPIGVKRSVELFGEIDTSVIVVRLQRPYYELFDYVEVSGGPLEGKYRIREQVYHRAKTVFYLEGVKT